jgi:hypothetical protein
MPLNIRYHKYRKFVRPFIILIILINSYVIFQSFNNDSDPIEQVMKVNENLFYNARFDIIHIFSQIHIIDHKHQN